MPKPERFVFVCLNQRPEGHPKGSCSLRGAPEVFYRFSELLEQKDLYSRVSLVKTGCLGPCFEGSMVAIFPENCWYRNVSQGDVEEIIEEHLINGNKVERLLLKDKEWG